MVVKKLKVAELSKILNAPSPSQATKRTTQPSLDPEELPYEKTVEEEDDLVQVYNKWNEGTENNLRIRELAYFTGEKKLKHLNVIRSPELKDTIKLEYHGSKYLLRKTTLDLAKAVINIYHKIKNQVETVVGYLVTVSGIVYLITKIDQTFFSFDAQLSSKTSQYTNPRFLDEESKMDILEKTVEHLVELNKKNLVISDLSIKNIFYSGKSVFLGDLRNLRMSLRPEVILGSLKSLLRQLLRMGVLTKEEVTYLLAYYMGGNPEVCYSWFKAKYSKDAEDLEVLEALEYSTIAQPA